MTHSLRLVLLFHNHQPVGNFDGVFEQAYQDSYKPFLDVLEQYPAMSIALHTSGSLMEWLVERHPEYVERLAVFALAGRIEIVGGDFLRADPDDDPHGRSHRPDFPLFGVAQQPVRRADQRHVDSRARVGAIAHARRRHRWHPLHRAG